jgi:hypothetical protein
MPLSQQPPRQKQRNVPTTLVVTVNTSSDDTVTAATMPRPVNVTVNIPWVSDLTTAEANNG